MENTEKPKNVWMFRLALATLIIGIGVALVALLAPMGFRLNLWGYRTGFAILRTLVPWCIYISSIAAIITVVMGILSRPWNVQNTPKLIGLPLIGAVLAGLTWYVPQTYLEPDGDPYPSIHDISTDTVNPPKFVAITPLRADADNGVEYGVSRDMNPELLAELTKQAYPDLQPVILDVSPDTAFNRAMAAAEAMGWEVVNSSRTFGRIEATDTSFWFKFKDDIVIRLRPESAGVRVDARSVSRMGKGDVGINAKRLRRFFELL